MIPLCIHTCVSYLHFVQSLKHSNPLPVRITFFFSPRPASSLHRPGAVSTHASPPRRLWLQPTIWLQLPGDKGYNKGFPKLEDSLFVLEEGGWEEHTRKIVPDSWLPKNAFGAECFEVNRFFMLLDVLFFSIPVVSHSHFNTSFPSPRLCPFFF